MVTFGNFEGTSAEKLRHARAYVAEFIDDAGCTLSDDEGEIVIRALRFDGVWFEERLNVELLPVEIVRHAVMRLGKRTRSPEVVSDWERWASAWQLIKTHGDRALEHAARQCDLLREDGEVGGAMLWQDIGRRIATLWANPDAWAGRA